MVTTNKKIRKTAAVRPSTRQLSPVEQAYVSELSSLHKRIETGTYQEYLHDIGPNGTFKWTLKRKRSLTAQNLQQHNELSSTSPTGIDRISPTGRTEWCGVGLSDLLASPKWSDVPNFPGKAWWPHVFMPKAYKRARAGLLKSQYSPWDYVSNGMPPSQSKEEAEWWKSANEEYKSRSPEKQLVVREAYERIWHYYVATKTWKEIPKCLGPLGGWTPPAWKYRWVEQNTTTTKKRVDVGPRNEQLAAQNLLLAVDEKPSKARIPVPDATGLSFVRWKPPQPLRDPILDIPGLSFIAWKKQQKPDQPLRPRPKRKLKTSLHEAPSKRQRRYNTQALTAVIDETGLSVSSWQKMRAERK